MPAEARAVHLAQERELRVYIAGPMTGLPDFNFPAFNAAADLMRSAGWHVENPAEHGHVHGAEWADYLRYDISRLATCEMIMLLPGWSKSKGANLEVAIARQLGMPIKLADGAEPAEQHQGELERLRKENESLRAGWYKDESDNNRYWPEELEEAKAELAARTADRDERLRKNLNYRDLLRAVINGKSRTQFDGDLLHRIQMALSASEDPSAAAECAICRDLGDQCMECEEVEFARWANVHFAAADFRKTDTGVYVQDWMRHAYGAWCARAALLGFKPTVLSKCVLCDQLQADLTALDEKLDQTQDLLRYMVYDYRSVVQAGYDKITGLGSDCDSVAKMLADNPNYQKALALLMPDLESRPEERGTPETEPCSGCGTPGYTGNCDKSVPY
ncbi:DUF4406 domain-containing protein [Pseudomonas sp. SbB1]|nr:DUF4406 domain-containing protein [Pseudomonas sp. T34]NOG90894.1 DUF4406 domain-containing protein [Pseudomonas sp. SbB1]HDS1715425.1 DUF4406 domain-containing protein [Pseudomonas putida]HDS1753764.1 DUF4406 domain-containing protein [Pseudomonas putida]